MQCKDVNELISLYIDGMLSPEEKSAVEDHLADCRSCSKELNDLKETINLLRSLGEVAPSEEFRQQLLEKITMEINEVKPPEKTSFNKGITKFKGIGNFIYGPWRYAAAAVLIVTLGIGAGIYKNVYFGGIHSYGKADSVAKSPMTLTMRDSSSEDKQYSINSIGAENNNQKFSPLKKSIADSAVPENAEKQRLTTDQYTASGKMGTASKDKVDLVNSQEYRVNDQKIIKDGAISLEVAKYRDFSEKLIPLIENLGGYIENSNENVSDSVTASFVIRVPAGNFLELVNQVESLGKTTSKQVSGRDVTGEYVDTQSRMRNLQKQEQRLLSLVDKANSLADVMTLENELGRVREEIEVLQGRLKSMDNTVTFSTIRLEVREAARPVAPVKTGWFNKTVTNFNNSINAIVNMFRDLSAFIGWFLPWGVLIIAAGLGIRLLSRKAGQRKKE